MIVFCVLMKKQEIIKSIATRTNGDIYLGVVGAVRTGKSTFINSVNKSLKCHRVRRVI